MGRRDETTTRWRASGREDDSWAGGGGLTNHWWLSVYVKCAFVMP